MFGHSNEPVTLERDCRGVIIPAGDEVTLKAGSHGFITQALGGSFTVYIEGSLFRVAGVDADALGKEPSKPPELAENPDFRQGLKDYFDWPTFPQLVVNGELVGGCDIIMELHESGELGDVLAQAKKA